MSKFYTSIEQSKRLLELGMSPESADLVCQGFKDEVTGDITYSMDFVCNWKSAYPDRNVFKDYDNTFIPCWSIGALLELFPVEYKVENALFDQTGKFTYSIELPRYRWRTYENENLIDVCFEAAVWLLENNYIKKED